MRRCGWTALALGGLLGPTIGALAVSLPRRFQGHPGWLIGGAALGTLAALLPAALTDIHVGWGALLFFTLPVTLGLLGYEISGRRARRRGQTFAVRIGPGMVDVRF